MGWIAAHWELIAAVAVALISIGNAITSHWSQSDGWVRWVKLAVELLSILTSRGTHAGQGPMGALKLPGQSVPPVIGYTPKPSAKVPSRIVGLVLVLGLAAQGCAAWPAAARKGLTAAHEAGKVVATAAIPLCELSARTCTVRPCPDLDRCQRVLGALVVLQDGVRAGLLAVDAYERVRGDLEAMGVRP